MPAGRTFLSVVLALLALSALPADAPAQPSPWTRLAGGRLGGHLWSVKLKPSQGPRGASQGPRNPCVMVGMMVRHGPFDFDRTRLRRCTRAPEHLSASAPPLIAAAEQPGQAGTSPLSTVGIVLASAVRRVRVTFAGGRKMTIALRPLTPSEASAASLASLRYAAFAVRGPWCPERLVSQDAAGKTLWDSGPNGYACRSYASSLP